MFKLYFLQLISLFAQLELESGSVPFAHVAMDHSHSQQSGNNQIIFREQVGN